jgi:hypothetical protein
MRWRRRATAKGATIPGTAVKLPRKTTDQVIAETSRPVPAVPDQGDLVEHWHEAGLLDEDECSRLGRDSS